MTRKWIEQLASYYLAQYMSELGLLNVWSCLMNTGVHMFISMVEMPTFLSSYHIYECNKAPFVEQ